ncbi:MAG: PTS sugar transporter subunit IIB [Coprobacillaceae bacterium]
MILKKVTGNVILWTNGIVEEIITRKSDDKLLFYLHYQIASISQCQSLFEEFYLALLQQSASSPIKILLCCSGGLTTSFFAEKICKLITLENLNIQVDSIAFHQLTKYYNDYDCVYLAPQIAYLMPEALRITNKEVPVYSIEPSIYATYNCQELLHSFLDNNKTTPIC